MRKLGKCVLYAYKNAVMNTHAALIPMFCGKGMYGHHVHEAVIAYGTKVSGCTVHFVDDDYDTGPIILQTPVMVMENDTPDTLAARILPEEHKTYVKAIQLFSEGRLQVDGRRVRVL
jgi:phosphoribosylglycinamide formyltransferase-1